MGLVLRQQDTRVYKYTQLLKFPRIYTVLHESCDNHLSRSHRPKCFGFLVGFVGFGLVVPPTWCLALLVFVKYLGIARVLPNAFLNIPVTLEQNDQFITSQGTKHTFDVV